MAHRVVHLKEPKQPQGPAIRLRRAKPDEGGCAFLVGYVDEKGGEDFRTLEEHIDYDAALKAANDRAHRLRIAVADATGVTQEQQEPLPSAKRQPAEKRARPRTPDAPAADLPSLASKFELPSIDERVSAFDPDIIESRVESVFRRGLDLYLDNHAELYGDSRNHAVAYTQRTHDQIQGQFYCVYAHMLTVQSVLYAYLETAFKRIDELESSRDGLTYKGVWKPGEHRRGEFVTHQGSLWHCERQTQLKPGDSDDFTLAVKRGRDGRDAKEAAA